MLRSVFDRYRIVNEDDLMRASRRVKKHHKEQVILKNGHNLGHTQAQHDQIQPEQQPVMD
jgi:hypothetical protein